MSDSMSQDNFILEQPSSNVLSGNVTSSSSYTRRQKSWDLLDQSALAQAKQHKPQPQHQVQKYNFFLP